MIDIVVERKWSGNDDYKDFVLNKSENGTVFHLPDFLDYHDNSFYNNTEKYLIKFIKDNKIIAGITGVIKEELGKRQFISPYGASYGGLVAADIPFHEYEIIYDQLFSFLKTVADSIKITATASIHSLLKRSFYNDYILLAKGCTIVKSDLVLVHELDENDKLIKRLDKKTATELNQPLKKNNLELELINGVDEETYSLLLSSQKRLESTPTHSLQELIKIENLLPNSIHSFKIKHESKLIAGIITFSVNKNVLNTFYIFDDGVMSREVKANHFSYYRVLEWAKNNNYKFLDFGPSSFGYTPNYPLIKFKEKFDSKPVLRHVYYLAFN